MTNNKSGFEDDEPTSYTVIECNHPEHSPPMHLYIPEGKRYRHVCPSCGMTLVIRPPRVRW